MLGELEIVQSEEFKIKIDDFDDEEEAEDDDLMDDEEEAEDDDW